MAKWAIERVTREHEADMRSREEYRADNARLAAAHGVGTGDVWQSRDKRDKGKCIMVLGIDYTGQMARVKTFDEAKWPGSGLGGPLRAIRLVTLRERYRKVE